MIRDQEINEGKNAKYLFSGCLLLLLVLLLITSREAGITCDEILHFRQSVSVYNYFASNGKDLSALDTPETHLKYYGQSFDNIVTLLINWFDIEDIYGFRHLMSSVAGWMVIMVTALFAVWLAGYRAGVFTLILFVISPGFIGHVHNNLKDIPFALGYIAGIFFCMKVIFNEKKPLLKDIICLTLSIALTISIRAGGLILVCYLFLFQFLYWTAIFLKEGLNPGLYCIGRRLLLLTIISATGMILSISLWPFALQSPPGNLIESYRVMEHFPATFRQLFEGNNEWSDLMPWYYLIKSMAITIPVIVPAGLIIFILFLKNIINSGKTLIYCFVIFTLLFPVVFVIIRDSNLYSSWRQFLFLYPGIVLISSTGFYYMFRAVNKKYLSVAISGTLLLLCIHPLKFMLENHPYYYLYYNQFAGGLRGAYGNYETDYYYVSQTEAAEWLKAFLKEKDTSGIIRVGAASSIDWSFRDQQRIVTTYFRYEERSMYDWDYAILVSRYVPALKLKNGTWPPENTIKVIYADEVPICAIVKRNTHYDHLGYKAMTDGRNKEAIGYFAKAVRDGEQDEMIFYNFALALYTDGQYEKADTLLKRALAINPAFEPALMYLGNIAKVHGRKDEAAYYYSELIKVNRKYFEAYVELAGLTVEKDVMKARSLLRDCLVLNPGYKPAVRLLADTYRASDPDVAKKYDNWLESVKY